eukprot:TRINITY_DN482_c0_g2_i3.p1 TRINITY_DN482_c0_g2~~TRINITY_DN482_c0_g2_i3.p1  ORF type:complete len:667 (-),score=212.88 TRINITY_DN482_c0_g2_i3:835-2835(-)
MSARGSSTKSEDRNTLRIREIQVGVSENKRCFDCRQRGPNYVNISVGAFVCTKCSGMLRGVTPPQRIKSISMSTFTNDDVSLVDSRGNLWCQKVWLATYSGGLDEEDLSGLGDEMLKQHILDKYEKKRYYIDPASISNLESYSSSTLRQNAAKTLGASSHSSTSSSSSSSLIGSRISQKMAPSGNHNSLMSSSSSSSTPSGSKLFPIGRVSASPQVVSIPSSGSTNGVSMLPSTNGGVNTLVSMDPFGSSSLTQAPLVSTNIINQSPAFEAFANFETANFEAPPADPYRSSAAATSLLQSGAGGRQSPEPSSSALVDPSSPSLLNALNSLFMPSPAGGGGGGPSNNLLVSPPPPALNSANNNNTSSSSSSLSNNNSNNTSKVVDKSHKQSYEDRYAALKDLDDIFRTAHISSDNIGSESNGVGSGFLGGGSTHPPAPAPSLNGVSSIFGSGESMITGGGSTSSNCGSTNSIMPSFFDSPQTKNNTDSWKRLSSNSVDNSGWANFGSNSATTPSSNSSTSIASNPFNNLVGGTSHNHHQQQLSSQLNTSPWPTTGTSPVQNAFSSSNTGPNGLSDPFSVSNQSFQNSSEKLTNDLFANAPMPNGGSKTSNLNQPGENPFSSSQLLDNALGSPGAAAAAAASNPWDASPFTDNNNIATPTFNPKNPFL